MARAPRTAGRRRRNANPRPLVRRGTWCDHRVVRTIVVAVTLLAALSAGCASEPAAEDATLRAEPAAAPAPSQAKKTGPRPPRLPRLEGEVLALSDGKGTRFVTLGGRELARLRGYTASTGLRPMFSNGGRLAWTLRGGRVSLSRERWNLRVRGFGASCGAVTHVRAGTILSCVGTPRSQPLLLRDRAGRVKRLVEPLSQVGHWEGASVSPDGGTLLVTWYAECEVPTALVVPVAGGTPRAVTGEADWTKAPESTALGWTNDGRALVHLHRGVCGYGAQRPGVYAFDGRERTFIAGPVRSAAFFPG